MNQVKLFFLCLTCIIFALPVKAQDSAASYSKFRLLLNSGERMEIGKGELTEDGLINYKSENNQEKIPFSDIRALDRRAGSKALLGLQAGMSIGLFFSSISSASFPSGSGAVIILGAAACCGLVGLFVGSAFDDWEKVPLQVDAKNDYTRQDYNLILKISL